MRVRHLLIALALAVASIANGAVDPSLFRDLHWRLIGPFRGGRVLAVTGVPGDAQHFYFGSVNGGIWETRDAGRTWQPIFDGQPAGSIGALALAPSNPSVIYAGTGEADMRSDISQGNGVYKSADGGKTWSHIGLTDSQQIARIVVHPKNPDVLYVAALGHPYGPNAERGLFRSKDGGASWKRVLSRDDRDTGGVDVVLEPGNPEVVYASLWQTRRTPWSVYPPSNGPGSGLFKSTDGGDHWTELRGQGLPSKPGRIGLAIAPSQPKRVYAIIDAAEGGMYRSDDAGATWKRTSADSRIWSRGWYFGGITVEPANPDIVYSCSVNVYRSVDGGTSFTPVKGAPGGDDYHSLWIDPDHPERRILGVDQGALVSVNSGSTWSSWFNQPTGQFYHVITDNSFPYRVYGSQQDSGAAGVPSRTSTIDGINMMDFREITAGGESDNVAPDPDDPDILYGGRVERLDTRTHQTRSIDPTLAHPENDRRTWTLPLVFSPRNHHVLYFSNQRLFRTEDGGDHWKVISGDLTREDPGAPPNLDAATAALKPQTGKRYGVIYAIAPSRMADGDIWVGTDDGQVWRTRDEGEHWSNITPPALTAWSKVGIIDASHFDAESAYIAVDRHRLEDVRPYVYRTHDGGRTWQLIAAGIPDGSFVNAVREDPVRKGMLYAGTERGVYVSLDDGDHWQTLQMNLPMTSVRDLDVHGNDLVIATHGRAFWVLDDLTSLRQADAVGAASVFLYRPATTIRERPAGFTGTPMPKDEPMAENPPFGAAIDYYLRSDSAEPVVLEILDGHQNLVRKYSSADEAPVANPAKLRTAPEWFATPSTLSTSAGMHRFIWPLRYPSPPALAGRDGVWSDGVWAPPGSYQIVLTVGSERHAQPLEITTDPRIKLPASAYDEQFALARKVEATRATVNAAVEECDEITKKLAARIIPGKAGLDSVDRAFDSAVAISGVDPANSSAWWLPPAGTASLHSIDTRLEKLMEAVDGADAAPSTDARASYDQLRVAADSALAAWTKFKTTWAAEIAVK